MIFFVKFCNCSEFHNLTRAAVLILWWTLHLQYTKQDLLLHIKSAHTFLEHMYQKSTTILPRRENVLFIVFVYLQRSMWQWGIVVRCNLITPLYRRSVCFRICMSICTNARRTHGHVNYAVYNLQGIFECDQSAMDSYANCTWRTRTGTSRTIPQFVNCDKVGGNVETRPTAALHELRKIIIYYC